ncbi:MAG: nucleotidyltransferase family protein [Bacteroidales bacterium]|nr:nucleotidyltransferase family protein [Bacteroidales bacterium]
MVLQTKGRKAMILAAGLGTRMKPMTDDKPKALVEWNGVPMLEHIILKLKKQGFTEIIINVHHFADMIVDFVKKKDHFGIRIEFSHERDEPLDTGGGISHASWFFGDEPFLVHNVDIMSNIDLAQLYDAHVRSNAIATLAVKDRVTSRSLLMNQDGLLKGWRDNRTGETIVVDSAEENLIPIAFSCVQVMEHAIFKFFPAEKRFSITPFYLELARTKPINLYRHDQDEWIDMGRLESYT